MIPVSGKICFAFDQRCCFEDFTASSPSSVIVSTSATSVRTGVVDQSANSVPPHPPSASSPPAKSARGEGARLESNSKSERGVSKSYTTPLCSPPSGFLSLHLRHDLAQVDSGIPSGFDAFEPRHGGQPLLGVAARLLSASGARRGSLRITQRSS